MSTPATATTTASAPTHARYKYKDRYGLAYTANTESHPPAALPLAPLPAHATGDYLLNVTDLKTKLRISRSKLYEMVADGEFPAPIKLGTLSRWHSTTVNRWLDAMLPPADANTIH
jgi:prophage regulatory protein